MATLGSLIISLEANTAKFESAMTKAEWAAKKASDNIIGAFKVLGAGLAAAFSISAMDATFDRITKYESDLLKMANRLNTTTETLSSFSVMIRKTGMDSDTFYTTLTRMDKGLSAAALGAEKATGKYDENGEEILKTAKAYDELGLNTKELIKLPWPERLMAIATAMKENIAPQDQIRIAMEMGGKSAAGMVNIFREGPEAMQKWIDRATELGLITSDMAKRGAEARSAAADLSLAWEGFSRTLVDAVAPAISTVLNLLTNLIAMREQAWQVMAMVHSEGAWEPSEITPGKPPAPPPIPKPPPEVFKPPARTPPESVKGGGKGGGGGDMGLDRMQSIIDTLQKDLSRLTEGSLAEIREWANKTRAEIEKVGRKGADTERAIALTADVESAKKKKATEDYYLFIAKESGDNYKQIEADAKDWLSKYKGFADAEVNIKKITDRKKWEEESKQESDRLGMQKSYLDSIASEMPLLSQRIEIKMRMMPIETELMQIELKRRLATMQITEAQKDELKALMALSAQAKKYGAEREKWRTEGTVGGLKIAAEDMKKQSETWVADTTAQFVEKMPNQLSSMIANSFVAFLQGKETDFKALGISMAQSFLQTMLEGILQEIIPEMLSGLADGMKGILESLGGELGGMLGGGGGIFGTIAGFFGFHEGGMIRAHRGWPGLRNDEVPIIAQTGERVLTREQNRAYEAGMVGGGNTNTTIYVNLPNQSQMELDKFARNITRSLKRQENRRII